MFTHAEQITRVSMDMARSFQAGAKSELPNAQICFDHFHVVQLVGDAMEEVRKAEAKTEPDLRSLRWALRKAPKRWSWCQLNDMHYFQRSGLKTARAWRLKEAMRTIYRTATDPEMAEALLAKWYSWARRCRLEPMKKVALTIKKHWDGILRSFEPGMHTGKLEAMNRRLQEARSRALGYRQTENFIAIAYLIAGKLTHLPQDPMRSVGAR